MNIFILALNDPCHDFPVWVLWSLLLLREALSVSSASLGSTGCRAADPSLTSPWVGSLQMVPETLSLSGCLMFGMYKKISPEEVGSVFPDAASLHTRSFPLCLHFFIGGKKMPLFCLHHLPVCYAPYKCRFSPFCVFLGFMRVGILLSLDHTIIITIIIII